MDRIADSINRSYPVCITAGLLFLCWWTSKPISVLLAFGMLIVFVSSVKWVTGKWRPDGSDRKSFPSGHTTMAWFFAATGLWYALPSPWIYLLFLWASLVGAARVCALRHDLTDVLAGVALGILGSLTTKNPLCTIPT